MTDEISLRVRYLGLKPYQTVWQAMSQFTDQRTDTTTDELWIVEHHPVYTQGQAGKPEHMLQPSTIPVVKSDRGGQITYHGPGQLILYPLINLRRRHLGVRELVTLLEQLVVQWLAGYDIEASARPDAPGVYVNDAKIASLGLRIRRGCSFHGISININMDLSPFDAINPCGYPGMAMIQLDQLIPSPLPTMATIQQQLVDIFSQQLGVSSVVELEQPLTILTE